VLAVDWNAVTIAGAFGVGAIVGTVVVLRLARVMAQFFGELRDRPDPPAPQPPPE
jgi:hypothetical protein